MFFIKKEEFLEALLTSTFHPLIIELRLSIEEKVYTKTVVDVSGRGRSSFGTCSVWRTNDLSGATDGLKETMTMLSCKKCSRKFSSSISCSYYLL